MEMPTVRDMDKVPAKGLRTDQMVLEVLKDGTPRTTLRNVITILSEHQDYVGRIWTDAFAGKVMLDGETLKDEAETGLNMDLTEQFEFYNLATSKVSEAIRYVAAQNHRHPVRQYLDGLVWDGTPRLDTFLVQHMGAQNTAYTRAVTACFGIMCVARIQSPGCKVDTIPILVGEQGARKSTALAALASPQWFADTVFDISNKDAMQMLQGVWIYELAELQAIKGRRADAVKGFVTSRMDHYRPPFGRNTIDLPRQTVFVGTTNDEEFLNDPTGSRRFWPVRVERVDIDGILAERDQFWAEAAHRYHEGESWWLSEHIEAERAAVAKMFEEVDAWQDLVAGWANNRLVPFSVADVLEEVLNIPVERHDRASTMRVAKILKQEGLVKLPRSRAHGRVTMWGKKE